MVEAGLEEVKIYVARLQKKSTQFIATIPLIDLCLVSERTWGCRCTSCGGAEEFGTGGDASRVKGRGYGGDVGVRG